MAQHRRSHDGRPPAMIAMRLAVAALMSGIGVLVLVTGRPAGIGWALLVLGTAAAASWE